MCLLLTLICVIYIYGFIFNFLWSLAKIPPKNFKHWSRIFLKSLAWGYYSFKGFVLIKKYESNKKYRIYKSSKFKKLGIK